MSILFFATLAWAVLALVAALVAITYGRKRALARLTEHQNTLDQLSSLRSASGRPFFAGPAARREFVRAVLPDIADLRGVPPTA